MYRLFIALGLLRLFPILAKSSLFVWNLGFCAQADVMPKLRDFHSKMNLFEERFIYDVRHYYDHLWDGCVVWVPADALTHFFHDLLPVIKHRIVIVSGGSDATFPKDFPQSEKVIKGIESEKVLHLFMQNCAFNHPKVSQIPIGLDFHTVAYWPERMHQPWPRRPRQQMQEIETILSKLKPTHARPSQIICDFAFNDTMHESYQRHREFGEDRKSIWKQLKNRPFISHLAKPISRNQLWELKGGCAFDISPPGNGIDCHRTWESLMLGCIVIVKHSFLDPLFEGLPIVIINSWDEITAENLEKWKKQYGDAFINPHYREKLTHHYWMKKIRRIQHNYFLTQWKRHHLPFRAKQTL